ncbi:helix-turn-helix transcriptional regulator [Paenibacillus sp. JNUCC31]|uniref:helix-turn-helix domain-containing protein n=1 Tax=Paenibacillus sp. JNUCC-31 TaxID=2777983 RepID=UPI00177E92CD|nr:helix-turn-helix transcriptional regulator [Paenibacillus sp. JNUCC-31]QOS81750.1 helix-turn-helix transcriptional regulator [Paenibacillus sp. JNUCC-31]
MKLKEAREAAGYTQESLVLKINEFMKCTLRHYQNIEYGLKIPSVVLGLLIAKLCRIDANTVDEWKIRNKEIQ